MHSTLEVSDGTRVRIEDGEFIRLDADGTRLEEVPRHEQPVGDRAAPETASRRQPVGVGPRSADASHGGPPGGEGRHGDGPSGGTPGNVSGSPHHSGAPEAAPDTAAGDGSVSRGEVDGNEAGHGRGDVAPSESLRGEPSPGRAHEPLPELTPEEKAKNSARLDALQTRSTDDFDRLKLDPDHKGRVTKQSEDEAKIGLDLREQGRIPDDIERPPNADEGDFYSPTTGKYYDLKGIHSDWPPFNFQRDKTRPFRGAYNPANNGKFISNIRNQIENKGRVVVLDTRNANQAAIDDVRREVEMNGWEDNVIWYP